MVVLTHRDMTSRATSASTSLTHFSSIEPCSVPGTRLGTRATTLNKIDIVHGPMELQKTDIEQMIIV